MRWNRNWCYWTPLRLTSLSLFSLRVASAGINSPVCNVNESVWFEAVGMMSVISCPACMSWTNLNYFSSKNILCWHLCVWFPWLQLLPWLWWTKLLTHRHVTLFSRRQQTFPPSCAERTSVGGFRWWRTRQSGPGLNILVVNTQQTHNNGVWLKVLDTAHVCFTDCNVSPRREMRSWFLLNVGGLVLVQSVQLATQRRSAGSPRV